MLIPLTGCMEQDKRQQLEKVAKDWCTTIRASQVIPVYPLTEDIQPGDVFLVRTPIQKQADEYKKKGFLPLDQRMTRFFGLDYRSFYQNSFGTAVNRNTPHHWQFPPDGLPVSPNAQKNKKDRPENKNEDVLETSKQDPAETGGEESTVTDKEPPVAGKKEPAANTHQQLTDWHNAPHAMFPSYSFNVQSGQGVTAALPIKGIPVGLSLMNADKAKATVSIKDAYTYGLPLDWIHDQIKNWAQKPLNKKMLEGYHKAAVESEKPLDWLFRKLTGKPEPTVYLRVINRVYLTGSLDVSMDTAKSGGFGGMFGEAPNAKIPTLDNASSLDEAVIKSYKSTLDAINETLDVNTGSSEFGKAIAGKGYGGRLKLVWAGGRSITLSETFDRPLVIGYLGFDFPIMPDGRLGLPVATRNLLTGVQPKEFPFMPIPPGELKAMSIALISSMKGALDDIANNQAIPPKVKQEAKNHLKKLNDLVSYLPEKYTFDLYSDAPSEGNFTLAQRVTKGKQVARINFDDVVYYLANINLALTMYGNMLGSENLLIDGKPVPEGFRKQLLESQKMALRAWEDIEKVEQDPVWIAAAEFCRLVLFGR